MQKARMAAAAAALALVVLAPTAAMADPPGPGDKQCRPGQQGNPQPAHKGGSC
ncbi:MAG: hypothetical protein KY454_00225 [Actinobacteria bacterium]|nr:hypothetical protein [Actinomycetota bacterium]MBW3648969.1 hypothetical protein [Actinomycetota bacterium]